MEEYRQITIDEWTQWKEDIRRKLNETAGNFVYIGYRLKQIRDSGMFDGAADIFEFAEKEYGLGKSTVSRFIAINEKYSEGGNSLELKEEFKGFSSSKLSEMLTLPDSEVELITEKTTVREIRELKAFNNEAEKLQEITKTATEAETASEAGIPLRKCLTDFFKDKKDMINGIMRLLDAEPPAYKEAAELMAPAQTSHQKGIVFLFMYNWDTGVKYKLMTSPEPAAISWTELLDLVYDIFEGCDRQNVWGDFYKGIEEQQTPEKTEEENAAPSESKCGVEPVATSQQTGKKTEEKDAAVSQQEEKKGQEAAGVEDKENRDNEPQAAACADSGQTEGHPDDPEPADTEDGTAGGAGENGAGGGADGEQSAGVAPVQPGEQLEGQMDISEYPEYMPENPEKTGAEDESAEAAGGEDQGEVIRDADGLEQYIKNQVEIIIDDLQTMNGRCRQHNWDGLIERAHKVIERVEAIKNMEEVWNG